jgi:hypothetical protein
MTSPVPKNDANKKPVICDRPKPHFQQRAMTAPSRPLVDDTLVVAATRHLFHLHTRQS